MPALKNESYTIDDIYALPDGQRAELIDGVIYDMSPPSFRHQYLSSKLVSKIDQYIEAKKGNCIVIASPFAVFLNADNKNYVEPDISIICDKTKINGKGCNGAPDWIIEIVSPSTRQNDYGIKLFKYCNAGVREYWIVDPIKNRITVYNFEDKTNVEEYTFSDKVKAGIYEDLEINFSEIEQYNGVRFYTFLKCVPKAWQKNETTVEEYTFADKVKAGIYEDLENEFSEMKQYGNVFLKKQGKSLLFRWFSDTLFM